MRCETRRDGDGAGGLRVMIGATRRMLTGQKSTAEQKLASMIAGSYLMETPTFLHSVIP
jgi:hypothetical protein